MTLLLFFVAPCAVYLCTRAHVAWLDRYLVVFQPALGLLIAAALGSLEQWLVRLVAERRSLLAPWTWAALSLLAGWVTVPTVERSASAHEALTTVGETLTYREQVQIARSLNERGIPPAQWLARVHGSSWWSWGIGPVSIGRWLGASLGTDHPGEHVLLVDRCARVDGGFATWQRSIVGWETRVLASYLSELEPMAVTVTPRHGDTWSGTVSSRLLPGHCGLAPETIAPAGNPASPPMPLDDVWRSEDSPTLRLHTALRPGPGDRVVAVQHGSRYQPIVLVRGSSRQPLPSTADVDTSVGGHVVDRYLIEAAERANGPVEIEVVIERSSDGAPERVSQLRFLELDVFEEPWPVCAEPR